MSQKPTVADAEHCGKLWDSQWVNVVTHDNCYAGWDMGEAINHAVKLTENHLRENFDAYAATLRQPSADSGLAEAEFFNRLSQNFSSEHMDLISDLWFAAGLGRPDSGRVHESAEDRFEQYVKTLIDKAPDVQKLGERLARLLDDDQFNNIEPTLLGIAAALAAQGQGAGEAAEWKRGDDYTPEEAHRDMFTAGIHVGKHDNAVECYADTAELAASIRDRILVAVHPAPAASPAGVPDGFFTELTRANDLANLSPKLDRERLLGRVATKYVAELLASAPSAKPEGAGGAA